MHPDQPPAPSRRTLLKGAAVSALTTVAFLAAAPSQPAAAAVPERPEPDARPQGTSAVRQDPRPPLSGNLGLAEPINRKDTRGPHRLRRHHLRGQRLPANRHR